MAPQIGGSIRHQQRGSATVGAAKPAATTPAVGSAGGDSKAAAARVAAAECDADKAWFADFPEEGMPDGFVEAHPAAFTKLLAKWTPECRAKAMTTLCATHGCDDLPSTQLIDAAATPDEKRAARTTRLTGNVEAVKRGRIHLAATQRLVNYALSIRNVPRPSSRGKSDEEMAEDLANGNPCLDRMRNDFARIDAANAAIGNDLSSLPFGLVGLRSELMLTKSCVDCSNDRSSCDELREPLKDATELLADYDKLIASDRAALASPRPAGLIDDRH
jgi:hypothetical protein